MKNQKLAFSLIEILIVVTIFGILAMVAAQSTLISLRGARKSDSLSDIRDNLDTTLSVMERNLRNAQAISSCTTTSVTFVDEYETTTSFSCQNVGINGYVASGSATMRLTSNEVSVTGCSITCTTPTSQTPAYVDIILTGTNTNLTGIDRSSVTVDTRVNLRVY